MNLVRTCVNADSPCAALHHLAVVLAEGTNRWEIGDLRPLFSAQKPFRKPIRIPNRGIRIMASDRAQGHCLDCRFGWLPRFNRAEVQPWDEEKRHAEP